MQTIGFIGTGIMGQGMIRNLMKAGYPVQIYNRTRSKAEALEREGAVWKDSAAQCAAGCGVVITIVGYPQDVEEVYFGPGGLLESAQPGTVLIDMTTTSPKLAQRIYDQARERGLDALDAPVSGGNTGAANGTLAIMAGGDGGRVPKGAARAGDHGGATSCWREARARASTPRWPTRSPSPGRWQGCARR